MAFQWQNGDLRRFGAEIAVARPGNRTHNPWLVQVHSFHPMGEAQASRTALTAWKMSSICVARGVLHCF